MNLRILRIVACLLLCGTITGCQTAYYSAMEKVGVHKREIMIDRIEATQTAQEQAQEQFQDALEQFRALVNFNGGNLEETYKKLNDEYKTSVSAAETVRSRINSVESVSEALFAEWQKELSLYSSAALRSSSASKLNETRAQYARMMSSLRSTESRMQPVLDAFQDQVLFLKHNLNAQAIASLKGEFGNIKSDIDRLIIQMQSSIEESRRFVEQLKTAS